MRPGYNLGPRPLGRSGPTERGILGCLAARVALGRVGCVYAIAPHEGRPLMEHLRVLRPVQWIKNVFVFAAVVFSRQLAGPLDQAFWALGRALGAFVCFSLASSAMYILNDIMDRQTDRVHPERRDRPIAAGTVSVPTAAWMALACALLAVTGSFVLSPRLAGIAVGYIVLIAGYSLGLKRVMILDCAIIASGFCLRAVAGAVVIDVFISPWLVICTFALTLFLAFSKRRGEIAQLQANSEAFRKTLGQYTPELLAHMLDVSSVLAVICFLLYAMDFRTRELFGTNDLVYTVPFVLYCIFRVSALTQKGSYSDPVRLILRDRPFQIGFVLWGVLCAVIVYGNGWLGS
jgi:4-hydroxybenzoate polyprenyltransferase